MSWKTQQLMLIFLAGSNLGFDYIRFISVVPIVKVLPAYRFVWH